MYTDRAGFIRIATPLIAQKLSAGFRSLEYCYGTLGMTREWLMKDNITPAETVVRMMFASMPETLRRVFFET